MEVRPVERRLVTLELRPDERSLLPLKIRLVKRRPVTVELGSKEVGDAAEVAAGEVGVVGVGAGEVVVVVAPVVVVVGL